MAEPRRRDNGVWTYQFSYNGSRPHVNLGKIEEVDARYIVAMIDRLVHSKKSLTALPPELALWVQSIPDPLAKFLTKWGLISNQHRDLTIGQVLDLFMAHYQELELVKPGTKTRMRTSLNRVSDKFREVKITSIDANVVQDIENTMLKHWAQATAARTMGDLLQAGIWAVKTNLCATNPFQGLPRLKTQVDKQYIETTIVVDVINNCICPNLATIFALARFGGLRIPSEIRQLRWEWYRRDEQVLLAAKSKQQKRLGTQTKFKAIPLWPRLDAALLEQFERSGTDSETIIEQETLRSTDTALRNRAVRAIKRAQHDPWPKIWQSLRYSYSEDVGRHFGIEEGARLTGHTAEVALKNYRSGDRNRVDVEAALATGLFS